MANNSINWLGNKVVDESMYRQLSKLDQTSDRKNWTPESPVETEYEATPPPPFQQGTMPPFQQEIPTPMQQGPPPITDRSYIPGYLLTKIGRNVRAEFVLGTSQYADKVGKLIEVGTNYFVLEDVNSRTHIMCDLYSVKFVTIIMT